MESSQAVSTQVEVPETLKRDHDRTKELLTSLDKGLKNRTEEVTLAIDKLGDERKSSVVRKALKKVNGIREALGKEPLRDLPVAIPGNSGNCVLARALGDSFGVGGSDFSMSTGSDDPDVGRQIAKQIGDQVEGIKPMMDEEGKFYGGFRDEEGDFGQIVEWYDSHQMRPYEEGSAQAHQK